MTTGQKHADLKIKLDGTELEQVTQFVYIGRLTEDGNCTTDIKR